MKSDQRVAIVDDDSHAAKVTSVLIGEVGLRGHIIGPSYDRPSDLVTRIRDEASGAIVDHRLQPGGFARFDGATAVAALFDAHIPAVLVTQFVMDADVSIRRWRHKIPVLLMRDQTDGPAVLRAFDVCEAEFAGRYMNERRPWRSLVRIEDVSSESGELVVDAVIPDWNPLQALRFPMSIVPDGIRERVVAGTRLFAAVNVSTRSEIDVYLTDVELAPAPDADDGLA